MSPRKFIVATLAVALACGVVLACQDDPTPMPCGEIPAGGCPPPVGASCSDPSCSAVYLCRGGAWELAQPCSGARDAAPDHAAVVLKDASGDVGPVFDGALPDGAAGGPGCLPLVVPDCALATAAACGPGCCGCEDMFVCENGGWNAWGICGPNGVQQK